MRHKTESNRNQDEQVGQHNHLTKPLIVAPAAKCRQAVVGTSSQLSVLSCQFPESGRILQPHIAILRTEYWVLSTGSFTSRNIPAPPRSVSRPGTRGRSKWLTTGRDT